MGELAHPLIPRQPVQPDRALPELERDVLERWRERAVFRRSLEQRKGATPWVFYEGPPTANGPPGAHHVLSRVFKDIYPRFQTMRGHYVERKGGWDCHGLPVEIAVEQKLGITSKGQIEQEIGIERFNHECRESVFAYVEEWNRLTERIGFWIDLDHAYRTMDESYIESVWWALAELHGQGLLYEALKVVPYCYRCQTALSSHEVALGYREVTEPSIYVRLPLSLQGERTIAFRSGDGTAGQVTFAQGDELLVWTTTPWTLPGNIAVAANPKLEYVRARVPEQERLGSAAGKVVILAAERVAAVLGEGAEVLERFPGSALIGASEEGAGEGVFYRSPIFTLSDRPPGGAPVIAGDFVSTEEGTGLVHIAPAFGADDFEVARAAGLAGSGASGPHDIYCPVRLDGTFDQRVKSIDGKTSYEGMKVKDERTTQLLIEDLAEHDRLLYELPYTHSYPHCWRCETPLIYLAKVSWYIRTSAKRRELLEANETVSWHPEHVKEGRFGEWLRGNVDWALSRDRYWGTPLPIWRCERGHVKVIGSFAQLEALADSRLEDHHRPYVDEVTFACDDRSGRAPLAGGAGEAGCPSPCAAPMRRVADVIDVWFDSGAMPFAQHHALSAADPAFRERFPADFICEALDQTRGWFYSLLAISTLLFEQAPYRNVVCLGLILDGEGQKMSKSRGNTVEPWEVIERYGADAFRWYLFTTKAPWDGYRFSIDAIGEQVRLFLRPLWNTLSFYALYARANTGTLAGDAPASSDQTALDRWILSRAATTAQEVAARLEAYDATTAGRALAQLLDDISNWYIRRSRRRFWDGEPAAFSTLRGCLLLFAQCLAPFCPFVADELYERLGGELDSVHLCDFPVGPSLPSREPELESAIELVRGAVRLGLAARASAKVKIRQPLAEAVIVAGEPERAAIEEHAELLRDELNVKRLRFLAAAEELGGYVVKPNYRTLGPRFGKAMPEVARALAALPAEQVAARLRAGQPIAITLAGAEQQLGPDDILLTLQAPEGFAVEREGARAVALDLHIDEELRREGRCREIVRAVQNARRNAGLAVEDRIELRLSGASELLAAADAYSDYLSGETLALDLVLDSAQRSVPYDHEEQVTIEGLDLAIELRRAVAED